MTTSDAQFSSVPEPGTAEQSAQQLTLPGLEVLLSPIPALLGIGVCGSICWAVGWHWALIPFLLLGIGGTALAVIDRRLMRLPNRIVLPLYVTGLAGLAGASALGAGWNRFVIGLICMAIFYGIFYLLALFGPMGFGDVKLIGVLALHLGWLGIQYAYAGVLLGTIAAALGALLLLALRRATWRGSRIAYGPYLLFGSWVAIVLFGFRS